MIFTIYPNIEMAELMKNLMQGTSLIRLYNEY